MDLFKLNSLLLRLRHGDNASLLTGYALPGAGRNLVERWGAAVHAPEAVACAVCQTPDS